MGEATGAVVREKVEQGIWRRTNAKGDWTYEVAYRDALGKQRVKKVEGGIRVARAALADAHAARNRGEAPPTKLTFREAAEAWYAAREGGWRPATRACYRTILSEHLLEEDNGFSDKKLAAIKPADLGAYIAVKRQTHKGWTIRGHITVISGVFNFAIRHLGLTGANPVSLLDRVERPKVEDQREHRILTDKELGRLLAAIEPEYRTLFRFAAETGARLGETLGLAWGDLDFERQTVTIRYQLSRSGQRTLLKTARSRRVIEITPGLVKELRKHRLAAPPSRSSDHDLVFLSRSGTAHDHRNIGGRVLARAVKKAKLAAIKRDGRVVQPAPTFHDLRHTHASALIAGGLDIEQVSNRLGHASVAVTMSVYTHEYDRTRRSDALRSKLADIYSGIENVG